MLDRKHHDFGSSMAQIMHNIELYPECRSTNEYTEIHIQEKRVSKKAWEMPEYPKYSFMFSGYMRLFHYEKWIKEQG